MSEESVCRRCGYAGPADARYCANCGRALVPPSARLTARITGVLSGFSSLHIGFVGLVLSVSIAVFAGHLIVMQFSFPLSLFLLALVIGGAYAYLGWQWKTALSIRALLTRMLIVFAGIGLSLVVVWTIDRALLGFLTDSSRTVVYSIPGVHIEASSGVRHISIINDPPYWSAVMVYGVLAAVAGSLAHRVNAHRSNQTT